jgi:hypothetical protein
VSEARESPSRQAVSPRRILDVIAVAVHGLSPYFREAHAATAPSWLPGTRAN